MTTRQGLLQLFVSLVSIAGFFIGVAGCISYVRLGSIAGKAIFLSPYFAATVMVCSSMLYAARSFPDHAKQLAIATVAAIIIARLGPQWSDVWTNGRISSADFATALILAGCAAALMLDARVLSQNQKLRMPRRDFIVALLGVMASTLTSFALIEENIVTRQKVAQRAAKTVALDVEERTTRAKTMIRRLTERWSAISHAPEHSFIAHELSTFTRDFTFFRSLALVDETGAIVSEHSRDDAGRRWYADPATETGLGALLQKSHQAGPAQIFVIIQTLQDRQTTLLVSPVIRAGMPNWAIVAVLDLADMVTWAMRRADESGYFRLSHGGRVLYQTAAQPPATAVAGGDISIPVHDDLVLQMSYVYSSTDTDLDTEVLAEFIWLVGIIFTFLLIASQRLTRIAQKRAAQLSYNALHDPLTGLPNRRLLEEKLIWACDNAKRTKQPLSVVFFDFDGIKLINDSVSHATGDAVLIEIARRLQRGAGTDAAVKQLGGIEFALLFTEMGIAQVQERTEALITDLARPYHINDRMLSITVNAGIVNSDGHVDDPMELVRQADLAMLRAKRKGRNTYDVYTEDLTTEIAERIALRADLQIAIDTDALELYHQPIIEGCTGRVTGVEALLRWPHETRGYISPDRFVQLAEETGQIEALTDWALATACHHRVVMRQHGLSSFPVIVNISPLYFLHKDFVGKVERCLQNAHLPPDCLEIEITESVFLESEEDVIQKLTRLRSLGIKTSVDDFGVGYSSLGYLKNLPIDKIKIDRSFITDVISTSADAAIVQGIISMAHHLGLKVVAEGVETGPQFSFLRQNNCDLFQGFLFSRPVPFDALVDMLSQAECRLLPAEPERKL